MNSPFTKITYILNFSTPPNIFGTVSQNYLRYCLPGCNLHFAPNKTLLAPLTLCIIFKSTTSWCKTWQESFLTG